MRQATKDRLFALRIEIPEEIAAGDNPSIDAWAARAIAEAEDAADAPPMPLDEAFQELLASSDIDLIGLLGRINDAAIELGELAVSEGDAAVYARLGDLPEWAPLRAWIDSVVVPADSGADPEPDNDVEVLVDVDDVEPEPAGAEPLHSRTRTPEELAAREESDAAALEGAEVTVRLAGEGEPGVEGEPADPEERSDLHHVAADLDKLYTRTGALDNEVARLRQSIELVDSGMVLFRERMDEIAGKVESLEHPEPFVHDDPEADPPESDESEEIDA